MENHFFHLTSAFPGELRAALALGARLLLRLDHFASGRTERRLHREVLVGYADTGLAEERHDHLGASLETVQTCSG